MDFSQLIGQRLRPTIRSATSELVGRELRSPESRVATTVTECACKGLARAALLPS